MMSDQYDINDLSEMVFMLGDFTYDGFNSKLEDLGYGLFRKTFISQPRNWEKFVNTLKFCGNHNKVAAVFIYMPSDNLLYGSQEAFVPIWEELLPELKKHRSVIFVYEDNLFNTFHHRGIQTPEEYEKDIREVMERSGSISEEFLNRHIEEETQKIINKLEDMKPWEEWAVNLLRVISDNDIEIVPFKRRSDIITRIEQTLDEVSRGIFLRLYIPRGRYQAEQLEGFLRLFEKYLQQVEGKMFSIDTLKTNHGLTYIFKNRDKGETIEEMDTAIQRFDHFMVLCKNDPERAEELLTKLGLNSVDALSIVSRFATVQKIRSPCVRQWAGLWAIGN